MVDSPTEYFQISSFTEDSFFQALSNPHCSPALVSKQGPAKYLFAYLKELQAKTILVELKYVDGDYLDDFSSYYVRCFQSYERFCKRIHFLAENYDNTNFLQILEKKNSDPSFLKFSKNYLGFIVARPLPTSVVGRTILKTYPSDNDRRSYPGIRKYYPNLFGMNMEIESLAYQQQDSVLAACATVALWSCYHKTNDLFGTPCPRPATITRVGNQFVGESRLFPSRGLTIAQICNSIKKLDLEPEVFNVTKDVPLISLIYGYMRMGLPVLLAAQIEGEGLHALTLAGYSLKKDIANTSEIFGSGQSIPMAGLRIDKFYAHDDQVGPFSRLAVKPGVVFKDFEFPVTFNGDWKDPISEQIRSIFPIAVIVPIYNKIRLTFLDIKKPLTRFNSFLNSLFVGIGKPFIQEWDVYLITTNSYKQEIKDQSFYPTSSELLLGPHPKYIWRAIYKINGKFILELLADATDVKLECPFYKMTVFDASFRPILKKIFNVESSQEKVRSFLIAHLTEPFYEFLKREINYINT